MPAFGDEPSLATLAELARSRDLADRAFAASAILLRQSAQDPAELAQVYERIRATARDVHESTRAQLRERQLDQAAFLAQLARAPLELRDHLVEEILDVAYPPLQRLQLPRDAVSYSPSGLAEILFVVAEAKLGPGQVFVDLGSGLGKVALLVSLLTGADAYGFELDPYLVAHARTAAASLRLGHAHFDTGDIRTVPLPVADAYYMFIPSLRSDDIAARLEPLAAKKPLQLFSQALDLRRLPWLKSRERASYWLEAYESTPAAVTSST
jgi:SAM-dependent methyltransferase